MCARMGKESDVFLPDALPTSLAPVENKASSGKEGEKKKKKKKGKEGEGRRRGWSKERFPLDLTANQRLVVWLVHKN